ncbi:shufflon system plasmid conjugative transfer pilus tip adhesin PilV [Pedobacter sp.]
MIYSIKRGTTTIASVKAQGTQTKEIITQDNVVLSFKLPNHVAFQRGDTVVVYGGTYEINQPEKIFISNTVNGFSYEITFEALYYRLGNWILKTLDQNNQLRQPLVYLMAKPYYVLKLIVDNANELDIDGGWSIGVIDSEEVLQHTFSSVTCLAALQDLANKYNTEFWFDGANGKRVNLSVRSASSGVVLEYGQGKGLYEITRDKSDKPFFNRLVIDGGSKNLPDDYGFSNLQLPVANRPWLEHASVTNGVVERVVRFEDIFPKRVGTVSSVGGSLEVFDSSLDFDINDHLTAESAKISFISGQLAGFTFSIGAYDHSTKKITLNLIDDDPAYPIGVPNAYLTAAIGDQYVLLSISMPSTYVTAAENKLLSIGNSLLTEGAVDQYNYEISITPKWAFENSFIPVLGNTINIKNADIGIDKHIRIIGYTRDLQDGWDVKPKIANKATVSDYFKNLYEQAKVNNAVTKSGLSSQNKPGTDTLDTVSKRGKYTSQVIEPRGVIVSDLFAPPTTDPSVSEMQVDRWYMSVKEEGFSAPPSHVIANLGDLLDVDATGRADNYVMFWDAAAGKYKFKAASFAPSGDVYTKTEINNFFGGISAITGYNKANWDSAFGWGNHAGLYQPLENQRLSTFDDVQFNSLYSYAISGSYIDGVDIYSSGEVRAALALRTSNGVIVEDVSGYAVTIVSAPIFANNTVLLPSNSGQLALVSQIPTNVVYNNGATYNINISGNAAKANGLGTYNYVDNDVASGFDFAFVRNGSQDIKLLSKANFKSALGLPTSGAYDLQGVTDRGATTTNQITAQAFNLRYADGSYYQGVRRNGIATEFFNAVTSGASNVYTFTGFDGSTNTTLLVLNNNGNVGIGTTNPIYKLEVNGNGHFYNELYVDGKIYATRIGGDGSAWGGAQLELTGTNPGIDYHYPGYYGASLHMNVDGILFWNGTGFYSQGFVNTGRLIAGYDSGIAGSVNASGWFRSSGETGWLNETYGGGFYMTDSTYLRVYNGKTFRANNALVDQKLTATTLQATGMFIVPKVEPAAIDMPVNEWVMYVKEVV